MKKFSLFKRLKKKKNIPIKEKTNLACDKKTLSKPKKFDDLIEWK